MDCHALRTRNDDITNNVIAGMDCHGFQPRNDSRKIASLQVWIASAFGLAMTAEKQRHCERSEAIRMVKARFA